MNSGLAITAALLVVFVVFLLFIMVMSRYVKVAPNQILVVSGRRRRLPDGTVVGFRVVKGGGTFVYPVLEKADVLSLDVLSVEIPRIKARTANGNSVEVDGMAQIKINGDDASIVPAMEFFWARSRLRSRGSCGRCWKSTWWRFWAVRARNPSCKVRQRAQRLSKRPPPGIWPRWV